MAVLHILDLDQPAIEQWVAEQQLPRFRAGQITSWIFQKRARTFEVMTDLPKALRQRLTEEFSVCQGTTVKHDKAADGTEKLLHELSDGGRIECVLLRDEDRRTICISSQVGCAMGCVFCASGLDGVKRNLTTGEIVEQMLALQDLLPEQERLSHIVVMGMGEPLANLDNLLMALQRASDPNGLGIGARRITVSTVGLPAAIRKLADNDTHFQLALSLHAPNDKLRSKIVPTNPKTGIGPIMDATDYYFDVTGRRLTYEYVLLADLNDQPEHARELVELLTRRNALLNVIPYNRVPGLPYRTPSPQSVKQFREILLKGGINVKIRQRKGNEINAACGQLRRARESINKEVFHSVEIGETRRPKRG